MVTSIELLCHSVYVSIRTRGCQSWVMELRVESRIPAGLPGLDDDTAPKRASPIVRIERALGLLSRWGLSVDAIWFPYWPALGSPRGP